MSMDRNEILTRATLAGYEQVVRPVLFRAGGGDPEVVHEQMIHALSLLPSALVQQGARLTAAGAREVEVAGIRFPNRVGIAGGLDKNGLAARAWAGLGAGHVELGTVTPRPQPGNERPRVFRAVSSRGIVNRMGFNNEGVEALAQRLESWGVRRGECTLGAVVGVSIGKNKTTPLDEAIDDYLTCLSTLDGLADYIAINVSSPNTPGLRQLQDAEALRELTEELVDEAAELCPENPVPIFVKVAPDLDTAALDELVGVCEDTGISGLIATNTTLSRDGLTAADRPLADQAGGLSGAPLSRRAREVVAHLAGSTSLPIIGVGGIMTPADARAMFDAGASLVQVYTGFIYAGPALVRGINQLPMGETR